MIPQRPYLVRAIHEWICDNGGTPYLLVDATADGVVVPQQFVRDGRIVLNVSPQAADGLHLGNDAVTFSARFSGRPMQVTLPLESILAVYGRENGQGMLFSSGNDDGPGGGSDGDKAPRGKPNLRVIK